MKGLKEMPTLKTGSKKTRAVVILALVIAVSVIGVAIAAWTTGGSGSGQASAGTAASRGRRPCMARSQASSSGCRPR